MLTNHISHTAWLVLFSQVALKKKPQFHHLIGEADAEFFSHCMNYCQRNATLYRLLKYIPDDVHLGWIESALALGAPLHYVLRKRKIAEYARQALASGAAQLVVMGGGFDALALRMAREHPEISCFEIDRPQMNRHKMAVIRSDDGGQPENFHGIGADLSTVSLPDVLRAQQAFSSEKPTLYVAEGVSMYLTEKQMEKLLSDIRRISGDGAQLVLTAIGQSRNCRSGVGRLIQWATLTTGNEKFYWGCPQPAMAEFLQKHAFTLQDSISYADLQKPLRSDDVHEMLTRQNGEYLVYAKRYIDIEQ